MRHTLLATLGTTPQVLTEAFYYYHRHLGITFDEIHVLTGAGGAPIDDVRTTADGDALAGQMLDIVRRLCADKDATVHAIASGGRKVMSLYGHRATDRRQATPPRLLLSARGSPDRRSFDSRTGPTRLH